MDYKLFGPSGLHERTNLRGISIAVAGALVSVASWDLGSIWILAGQMCLVECLPSGYVKIAIENGHRNSGFSH